MTFLPGCRCRNIRFLLTHPLWDVTQQSFFQPKSVLHFYSHIPCGMWQEFYRNFHAPEWFLLTHPLWDVTGLNCNPFRHSPFLLTHPLWDVTAPCRLFHLPYYISTHTSLVGCDMINREKKEQDYYFYSHIPCGMWFYFYAPTIWNCISTHTSLVGCDQSPNCMLVN